MPDMSEPDESKFDELTPGGVAATATGAAVGVAADLFIFPGASGIVGPTIQSTVNFIGRGLERRKAKAAMAVIEASKTTDATPDEMLNRAWQDDSRTELALKALTAAAEASDLQKIRALGRALGLGVLATDVAIVDRERYIVDALARLEAPHVRVLDILNEPRIPPLNGQIYTSSDRAWQLEATAARYPQAGSTLPPILATLVSIGAVVDSATGTFGGPPAAYETNEFGKLLLTRLREVAAEPE